MLSVMQRKFVLLLRIWMRTDGIPLKVNMTIPKLAAGLKGAIIFLGDGVRIVLFLLLAVHVIMYLRTYPVAFLFNQKKIGE